MRHSSAVAACFSERKPTVIADVYSNPNGEIAAPPRECNTESAGNSVVSWHQNVDCRWSDGPLFLSTENDYDPQGLALMDEPDGERRVW